MFADGCIRAKLDWAAVRATCRVGESFERSRDRLGDLFTVWYADADGGHRLFDAPDARPLRVRDVPSSARSTWPERRAKGIGALTELFRAADRPVQLPLPGYALGDGEILVLDGTHRAVAGYVAEADVRLMLYVLHGPIDESILPDLRHHLFQHRRPSP